MPQSGTTGVCNYPTTATALYQFEGNANDTCGSFNAASTSGVTYSTGKYGQAAVFNGSNSSIILPQTTDFDLNGAGSFSIWVLSLIHI